MWGIAVSIFEMDQNWHELNPRKLVRILKIVFSIFLLSGISNTSIFKVHVLD